MMQDNLLFEITILNLIGLMVTVAVILSRKARGRKVFSKPLTAKDTVLAVVFGIAGMLIMMLIESTGSKAATVWSNPTEWILGACYGIITTVDAILSVRL